MSHGRPSVNVTRTWRFPVLNWAVDGDRRQANNSGADAKRARHTRHLPWARHPEEESERRDPDKGEYYSGCWQASSKTDTRHRPWDLFQVRGQRHEWVVSRAWPP